MLGSSNCEEWEFQIILGPPSWKAWKCGKLKKVGRVVHGSPTLFNIAKVVDHHDEQHMNDVLNLIYDPPSKWVTLEWIDMHIEVPLVVQG